MDLNYFYVNDVKTQFLKHAVSINKTSKDRIVKELRNGGDPKETIEKLYKDFINNRSYTIAETTAVSGFNAGLLAGYKLQGYKKKMWVCQLLPTSRDSHVLANGQTVGIDEYFSVGSDLLQFPGDPTGSAEEVINCLCVIIGEK